MKTKRTRFLLLFVVLIMLPSSALAAETGSPLYDENDFYKLQTFLNLPSASSSETNGKRINPGYDPADPLTWTGIVWNEDVPKRAVSIGGGSAWYNKSLAGRLDLSGFSALKQLTCTENELTSIDVSGAAALESLYCYGNELTELTLGVNSGLTGLYCANNDLTAVDLTNAPSLNWLQCGNNSLSTLNVASNADLTAISCEENQLISIDTSQNAKLRTLRVSSNELTELNIALNPLLTQADCSNNLLTEMDVSKNVLLLSLNCSGNKLTDLDIGKNIDLQTLDCSDNQLSSIDVTRNTGLIYFRCYVNSISFMDLSRNARLRELNCRDNQLTSLDAVATAGLTVFDSTGNQMTHISANLNGSIITLNSNGNGFVELVKLKSGPASATAAAVPRPGSVFINWSGTDGSVSSDAKFNLAANTAYDFTANFEDSSVPESEQLPAAEAHAVSYHPNGGTGTAPVDMRRHYAGEKVTLQNGSGLSNPGMILMGWVTAEGEQVSDPFIMPDRDVTLFAFWQKADLPAIPKTGGSLSRIGPILFAAGLALTIAVACIKHGRSNR